MEGLFQDSDIFYFAGEINEIIFEAMLLKKQETSDFTKDAEFINGLQSHEVLLQRHVPLHKAKVGRVVETDKYNDYYNIAPYPNL